MVEAYNQVVDAPNGADPHRFLIIKAASYAAVKAFDDHCEKYGKLPIPVSKATRVTYIGSPDSRREVEKMLNDSVAAFVDSIIEKDKLDPVYAEDVKGEAFDIIIQTGFCI
ncbi:uncharacterized protein N7469_001928 [Penicillium citrinum]|uniref:Uncharacterized protein n=1 Tax=Penicillium citrinum TaxID=5077 RepID=A0A9W9TT80_PENCI|nr:uncharacterized protein N7469_001928 [Penicillium citrinum]KAJ5240337.1 hypothetical protein N7469_001928 [Penicillium citrinum]